MSALRSCGKRWATEDAARCSKRFLAGGYGAVPCSYGCNGWHLRNVASARTESTGPDDLTRAVVLERDGCRCVCCGVSVLGRIWSIQHRKRRSQGGRNCTCNLVTVLGDGTRGCHARIDSRIDPEDEAKGYTVRSRKVPALVSVMVFDESGGGSSVYPTCDGAWSTAMPEGCAA